MKNMIAVISQGTEEAAGYKVYAYNDVCIGDFLMSEDGFYNWWPVKERDGYFPSYILYALAEHLTLLNANWEQQIERLNEQR